MSPKSNLKSLFPKYKQIGTALFILQMSVWEVANTQTQLTLLLETLPAS